MMAYVEPFHTLMILVRCILPLILMLRIRKT